MSISALKKELEQLLLEYKTLQERKESLKSNYFNKGFENDSKTMQFFINAFGYTRDYDNKDDLHTSCIIDRILTTDDVNTISSYKRNGVLRGGVKQFKEPCGLENKNVRDTDTGRIGFVASDGTLQIYPEDMEPPNTTIDNCPNYKARINVNFNDFAITNDLSTKNPCKATLESGLVVEMNRVHNNINLVFDTLKREMKKQPVTSSESMDTSDISLNDKIKEVKELYKEFKETQSDIDSLEGVESVADTMRIFSFHRIFLWIFIAMLGFSFVYSIQRNGGKMSIKSTIIIGVIICMVFYMNKHIIEKLFQNI